MLVVAGVVLLFLLPTPLRIQVVRHMPRRVSVCVRPNCSTTPRVVLVVRHLPHHVAMCVRPNYRPPPLAVPFAQLAAMVGGLSCGEVGFHGHGGGRLRRGHLRANVLEVSTLGLSSFGMRAVAGELSWGTGLGVSFPERLEKKRGHIQHRASFPRSSVSAPLHIRWGKSALIGNLDARRHIFKCKC